MTASRLRQNPSQPPQAGDVVIADGQQQLSILTEGYLLHLADMGLPLGGYLAGLDIQEMDPPRGIPTCRQASGGAEIQAGCCGVHFLLQQDFHMEEFPALR